MGTLDVMSLSSVFKWFRLVQFLHSLYLASSCPVGRVLFSELCFLMYL